MASKGREIFVEETIVPLWHQVCKCITRTKKTEKLSKDFEKHNMQTGGVWMVAWLEHAACQLQAVEQLFFAVVESFILISPVHNEVSGLLSLHKLLAS